MPIRTSFRPLPVLAWMIVASACASTGHSGDIDPAEDVVGDVDAPPLLPDTVLGWDGPADDATTTWTEPGELPQLFAPDGAPLPLRKTDVHADVRGHVAEVVVTQRFVNDRETPIEVVYTFPLPENAAVADMRMVIGARVIESDVRKREEAQEAYEAARKEGYTAALLEQERPNVFTQSVANIDAGAEIDVEIRYLQTLSFDAGTFELVFPTSVGPRYLPGTPMTAGPSGTGTRPDTDRVPDASRISPPLVDHDAHAGDELAIAVDIDAGGVIEEHWAPAHEIDAQRDGSRLHVELAADDERPNRDFVLRWRTSPTEVRSTLFLGPPGPEGDGFFELLVVPPAIDVDRKIGRRELVFVLDVSGSMYGVPLALEKALLREALQRLRPVDTFDVVTFAGTANRLFATPQPANAARIAEALRFVDGLEAGGGTEMLDGVELSLGGAVAAGRNRYVVFMTDGEIGFEAEIFAAARALVTRLAEAHHVARVFAVGVGASPNRHLLHGLAVAGRGMTLSVSGREHPEPAIAAIHRVIDAAILTRVEVDWNGAVVDSMFPSAVPDLFASHVTVVHGRYRGAVPTSGIELRGHAGGREIVVPVRVVASREDDAVLAKLWAREQIAAHEEDLWATGDERAEKKIEWLGLEYHLVTAYTSLVAIDRTHRVDGEATKIVQPTYAPEGVDVEMAGGESYGVILGGSTGVEAKYTVEGASINAPRFATSSRAMMSRISSQRAATRSLSIASIEGGDRKARTRSRRAIRARRADMSYCLAKASQRGPVDLELRITVKAGVAILQPLDPDGIDGTAVSCIERALQRVSWHDVPDGTYDVTLRWS